MNYSLNQKSATGVTVNVTVPYLEIKPTLPKAAEVISANIEIEGFRKGKAPYEVIKQKVGEFKILEEAARLYIGQHFTEIIERVKEEEYKGQSFELIGEPAVSITKLAPNEDLEYRIQLTLLPPITLPNYKAIAMRVLDGKKVPEVTSQDKESAINRLRESRTKLITVHRASEIKDRVEVDFQASEAGVPIEGGDSKNHPFILGESRFIPGFEDFLIGMKASDVKTFSLLVPKDHSDTRIQGKTLDFHVEMKLVQERERPDWNDTFAASLGTFTTIQEVEKNIEENLRKEKEEKERERLRMAMIDEITSNTKAEIPEPLIARELEKMVTELRQSIERMGLKFDEYLEHIKKTTEDLKREWEKDAERRVKIALALREIARKEHIEPTEEDIQETAKHTIARLGLTEENIKTIDREAFLDYNRGIARNEKVFQLLENIENIK